MSSSTKTLGAFEAGSATSSEHGEGSSNHYDVKPKVNDYYLSDMLTKRGGEYVHVYLWMLKDFAWVRVWDYRIVATIGSIAVAAAFLIVLRETIDICKSKNWNNRHKRYEDGKELISSIGAFLWLTGNIWWAVGECWDLTYTNGYNEVYEQYADQGAIIFYFGCVLLTIFWLANFLIETFGLSKTAYEIKMIRHADHLRCVGESVPYAVPTFMTAYEACSDESLPRCYANEANRGVPESIQINAMQVYGMPDKQVGPMGTPAGYPCLKTGNVADKRKITMSKGLYSFRDYENIIVFYWIWKDVAWYWEDPLWAKIVWFAGGLLAFFTTAECFITLGRHYKSCEVRLADLVNSFAFVFWIFCNVLWGYSEMFLDHETEWLPQDPEEGIKYLCPPLFSNYNLIPNACWKVRWIAGWLLFIGLIVLTILYAYMAISDAITFRRRRHNKST